MSSRRGIAAPRSPRRSSRSAPFCAGGVAVTIAVVPRRSSRRRLRYSRLLDAEGCVVTQQADAVAIEDLGIALQCLGGQGDRIVVDRDVGRAGGEPLMDLPHRT